MNPFNNPLLSVLLFITAVSILAAFVTFKQKRSEAALAKMSPFEVAVQKGFAGTEEEWVASLTRRERRQIQFAGQTPEELSERAQKAQERFYGEFVDHLNNAVFNSNMPFIDGVNNILAVAERELKTYRARAHKQDDTDNFISMNDVVIGVKVCEAVVFYAQRCKVTDMGCIGMALMKFVEHNFRVRHLNGVLYRNKGTVSHSVRCSSMAHSILKYFNDYGLEDEYVSTSVPFDYLPEQWLFENEVFRREFFELAIDETYASMMKAAVKNPFSKSERLRNLEHENNRKQRRRRVTKSKKRN